MQTMESKCRLHSMAATSKKTHEQYCTEQNKLANKELPPHVVTCGQTAASRQRAATQPAGQPTGNCPCHPHRRTILEHAHTPTLPAILSLHP